MWLFKKRNKVKCGICGRRRTVVEWEDLKPGQPPNNAPCRCETCNQVSCLMCLRKVTVRWTIFGRKVEYVCPRCGSPVKFVFRETPEEIVRRRAKELQAEHGVLIEVRCRDTRGIGENIEVVYEDGAVVDGNLGGHRRLITSFLIVGWPTKFGYEDQGLRRLHAFLVESGFQILADEVYRRSLPYTLRREQVEPKTEY